MRILFALSSPEYLRYYDMTIEALALRGHDVVVAVGTVRDGKPVPLTAVQAITPRVTAAGLVPPRADRWTALARAIRGTMDFVRYLHPDLAPASVLRARAKRHALPSALQGLDRIRVLKPRTVARIMRALARAEPAIPPGAALVDFLDAHRPDLVLVTPLVELASDQVDLVRAAQARGTRVATLVASWDNLTNKGDLRVATDLVVVWNEAQKREAVEYHRVPAERIVMTGAQPFDRWFNRGPSRSRAAFCRDVGLPDERPFVLFTGSSIFIARAEAETAFVRRWIQALRSSSDAGVRDLAVLVRPHPYNGRAWNPDAFADLPGVTVWPRGGYDPIDAANRDGLFDSLFHAEAVVGINTSAMIEAAIVGRPVLSISASEFAETQDGTLHFRHLLRENGGFLRVASTFDEHLGQLADVRREPQSVNRDLSRFVGTFVRPHGAGRESNAVLVDAIERYGRSPAPQPVRRSLAAMLSSAVLYPISLLTSLLAAPSERKRQVRRASLAKPERRHSKGAPAPALAQRTRRAAHAALLLPTLSATLLVMLFAILQVAGQAPFSYEPPRNIAEAAGMAMESEVLRFLRQGQDPSDVFDVRPEIISSSVTRATGLEATIYSRRLRLIGILEREGAIRDDATRQHLVCLAKDISADELAERLNPEGSYQCEAGRAKRLIADRSQ